MDSLYEGRKKTGYSLEEAYFHQENQRLIQKIRERTRAQGGQETQEQGVVIDAKERFEQRRSNNNNNKIAKSKGKKAA